MSAVAPSSVPYLSLSSGSKQPMIGLGMWKASPGSGSASVADLVYQAIKMGYRHFDSACDYGNEQETGAGIAKALKEGIVQRSELFITSKLWCTYHHQEHVKPALDRILQDLQLEYLDLFLIHFPISLEYVDMKTRYPPGWSAAGDPKQAVKSDATIRETWEAMESLLPSGSVRSIGISNFCSALIQDLLRYAKVRPAVNQIEVHPLLPCTRLIQYCQHENIQVTAFSPLGSSSYIGLFDEAKSATNLLTHPSVTQLAEQHKKSPAQILLRWSIERGCAVVPKSSNPDRLKENIQLFDFKLSAADMKALEKLDEHLRFNDPGQFARIPIWD